MFRIETDRARFREIVRGRLRKDLRKYLSTTELLGRRGERFVSIPVPQIELPRFHFGENKKGVGQGQGEKGASGKHLARLVANLDQKQAARRNRRTAFRPRPAVQQSLYLGRPQVPLPHFN